MPPISIPDLIAKYVAEQGPVQEVGGPRWKFPEPPYLPITPEISNRFQRRLQNADDDMALQKVVRDAAKYGVDWTHMLAK